MKKLNFLLILSFALVLTNCKDKDKLNDEKPILPPTAAVFQNMRQTFLDGITQTKTLNVTETFTSEKGVKLTFNYMNTANGQPVSGSVQLKYIEMFDIGTIAFGNRPLIGRNWDGQKAALVTGGEFFIKASQGGNDLTGSVNLEVPTTLTNNPEEIADRMQAWLWNDDADEWTMDNDEAFANGKGATGKDATNIYACQFPFGWTNIDWLYSLDGKKTAIRVKVPEGFNNTNCAVYAAYVGMPNTLAHFDTYVDSGADAPYFTEHTGIGPVGYRMYIIFLSANPSTTQATYALKTVTLAEDEFIYINQSDLQSVSIQDVINAINNLYH